jgi:AcrR family transcriptional regulator
MNQNSATKGKILPLRARLKEETQRAILQAAEAVFGESGLSGARMEDIASRAGVSVGTLYNHFEDRDTLLSELITSRRHDLAERLDSVLAASFHHSFAAQLEEFLAAVLRHFEAHKAFLAILLESEHARAASPVAPRGGRPNAALLEVYRRVEELTARGQRSHALRLDGAELFPSFLMGMLKGTLARELYAPSQVPLADRAPAMVLFFLQGAGLHGVGG